ncbi:hypothetical protein LXL04_010893 [Taraxacum kok-saghyz]
MRRAEKKQSDRGRRSTWRKECCHSQLLLPNEPLMVSAVTHSSEIMKIVHKYYPNLANLERYKDIKGVGPPLFYVSRVKAESLGVNFTPVEISIKDTIQSLKEKMFLSF